MSIATFLEIRFRSHHRLYETGSVYSGPKCTTQTRFEGSKNKLSFISLSRLVCRKVRGEKGAESKKCAKQGKKGQSKKRKVGRNTKKLT